jgi:hypothetical protein
MLKTGLGREFRRISHGPAIRHQQPLRPGLQLGRNHSELSRNVDRRRSFLCTADGRLGRAKLSNSRYAEEVTMTRFLKHCSFPYVSSTLVATLISLAATVLVVPVIVTPQPEQSSTLSHDSHFYRLSPIPAGADWARS